MALQPLWLEAEAIASEAHRLRTAGALMVLPYTDLEQARRSVDMAVQRAGLLPAEGLLVAVHDAKRRGFVSVLNAVYAHSQSTWLGYMAQDAFAGRGWLQLALAALAQGQGGLLAFNDGKWGGALAAFGLARRDWVAQVYGDSFFFPGYRSHYADVELTLIAQAQGCLVYEPQSVLVEVDWNKERSAVHPDDRRLFRARVRQGLGGRVLDPQLLARFA